MGKNSIEIQRIEDFYKNKDYEGTRLRRALERDRDWAMLVEKRKRALSRSLKLTKSEKNKYVLSTDYDYEILARIKRLEKMNLSKKDEAIVRISKTQLEHDWRKPLISALDKIIKKYPKTR